VNVFELDRALVSDYERFARSFTQIRAPDIRSQVEEIYATNRFWPEPLISINPNFERGASVADLAADQTLHSDTARVFRVAPARSYGRKRLGRAALLGRRETRQCYLGFQIVQLSVH
jgi:hypothetical protein